MAFTISQSSPATQLHSPDGAAADGSDSLRDAVKTDVNALVAEMNQVDSDLQYNRQLKDRLDGVVASLMDQARTASGPQLQTLDRQLQAILQDSGGCLPFGLGTASTTLRIQQLEALLPAAGTAAAPPPEAAVRSEIQALASGDGGLIPQLREHLNQEVDLRLKRHAIDASTADAQKAAIARDMGDLERRLGAATQGARLETLDSVKSELQVLRESTHVTSRWQVVDWHGLQAKLDHLIQGVPATQDQAIRQDLTRRVDDLIHPLRSSSSHRPSGILGHPRSSTAMAPGLSSALAQARQDALTALSPSAIAGVLRDMQSRIPQGQGPAAAAQACCDLLHDAVAQAQHRTRQHASDLGNALLDKICQDPASIADIGSPSGKLMAQVAPDIHVGAARLMTALSKQEGARKHLDRCAEALAHADPQTLDGLTGEFDLAQRDLAAADQDVQGAYAVFGQAILAFKQDQMEPGFQRKAMDLSGLQDVDSALVGLDGPQSDRSLSPVDALAKLMALAPPAASKAQMQVRQQINRIGRLSDEISGRLQVYARDHRPGSRLSGLDPATRDDMAFLAAQAGDLRTDLETAEGIDLKNLEGQLQALREGLSKPQLKPADVADLRKQYLDLVKSPPAASPVVDAAPSPKPAPAGG